MVNGWHQSAGQIIITAYPPNASNGPVVQLVINGT